MRCERDNLIDILRVLGTLLVILAHVDPPEMISTLRSFDVCLLVLISGYSFVLSYKEQKYLNYVKKRIKRLCIPSYISQAIVFVSCFFICLVFKNKFPYDIRQIVESVLFIGGLKGGVGYYWIVRIYLLMALVAPIMNRINRIIKSDYFLIAISILLITINQVLYSSLFINDGSVSDLLLENYVLSLIGYSAVYLVGIRLASAPKALYKCIIVFLPLFILSQFIVNNGGKYIVSQYKYPPQVYYLIFGISISLLLVFLIRIAFSKRRNFPIVTWISQNSFRIYLVHIFFLFMLRWGYRYFERIKVLDIWFVRYIFILVCTMLVTKYINLVIMRVKSMKTQKVI